MSKFINKVLPIAAALLVPFAAPAVAAALGTSAVVSGAIAGAGLQAGAALATGGNVGKAALLGGVGGGLYGYLSAPAAPSQYSLTGGTPAAGVGAGVAEPVSYSLSSATPSLAAPATPGFTGISPTAAGINTGLSLPSAAGAGVTTAGLSSAAAFAPVDYGLTAGAQLPSLSGINPATAGLGLRVPDPGFFNAAVQQSLASGTPVDYGLSAGMPPATGLNVTSANPVTGGTQVTTGAGTFQSTTPTAQYSDGSYVGPTGMAAAPIAQGGTGATPQFTTYTQALKDKLTDPRSLADMTLRAAGMLAGSLIAGDGLSDEERVLLQQQTDELRQLQQTNASLFAQRLEQAQNLIGESRYFDPEYFGLQRARRAQTAGARAKRAGLRGLEGAAREAEARRFDLATARDVGSAFDQGYLTAVQGRLGTTQAGMQMMPTSYPSSSQEYAALSRAYGGAATRARQTQQDIGNLFGSLTGRST